MDHEGRRGGARAFGRRPTTRAAAWRCLAHHALKCTRQPTGKVPVREEEPVPGRATCVAVPRRGARRVPPLGRACPGVVFVSVSPELARGPPDSFMLQSRSLLFKHRGPHCHWRASTCQTLRLGRVSSTIHAVPAPRTYARHTGQSHSKPQYRGAGARSRRICRRAGNHPARLSVPSRLAARHSPTWAVVTPPLAALAASLPTGHRAPLEPEPRLRPRKPSLPPSSPPWHPRRETLRLTSLP